MSEEDYEIIDKTETENDTKKSIDLDSNNILWGLVGIVGIVFIAFVLIAWILINAITSIILLQTYNINGLWYVIKISALATLTPIILIITLYPTFSMIKKDDGVIKRIIMFVVTIILICMAVLCIDANIINMHLSMNEHIFVLTYLAIVPALLALIINAIGIVLAIRRAKSSPRLSDKPTKENISKFLEQTNNKKENDQNGK